MLDLIESLEESGEVASAVLSMLQIIQQLDDASLQRHLLVLPKRYPRDIFGVGRAPVFAHFRLRQLNRHLPDEL